jgi:hypothetical protein
VEATSSTQLTPVSGSWTVDDPSARKETLVVVWFVGEMNSEYVKIQRRRRGNILEEP